MKKLSIQACEVKDKVCLLRLDLNVPLRQDGSVADNTKIKAALPTIDYLVKQEAKVVIISHLGRPKGTANNKYSLAPIAKVLKDLLDKPVQFLNDCIGPEVESAIQAMKAEDIILLENLRFHPAEEKPELDRSFAKQLANLADLFVNDAFATCHRKHSSMTEICQHVPQAAMGFLVEQELAAFHPLMINPKRPFFALLGGSKIDTKIGVIKSLLQKVDALFIGGAMAFSFLSAKGHKIQGDFCDESSTIVAKSVIDTCEEKNVQLYLPSDLMLSKSVDRAIDIRTQNANQSLPEGYYAVDIGESTVKDWQSRLSLGKTIFWNGPLGVCEVKEFSKGTEYIAKSIAALEATSIVGGGDSVRAIKELHLDDSFTHLSTGGGASLELLEKGHLPAIESLTNS